MYRGIVIVDDRGYDVGGSVVGRVEKNVLGMYGDVDGIERDDVGDGRGMGGGVGGDVEVLEEGDVWEEGGGVG